MKCPKCGFDQPEDRFCANCGVDVTLYVPKRQVLRSITRSTTFYVVIATLVLVFGLWFLLTRGSSDEKTYTADRSNSIFKRNQPAKGTAESEDVGGTASKEVAPATPTPKTDTFNPPPPAQPAPGLKPKATTFRLSFYEVTVEYAPTLLGAATDGSLGIGVVTEDARKKFADKLKEGTENNLITRIGSSVQTISTDEQTTNTFSFITQDPRIGAEIGLMFQLKASQLSETGSVVSVEGRRIIGRDDSPQADVLNFQREVTIPLKLPAYIVGLVRGRNPVDANEMNAFAANPVFTVFRSERFRANQSLLVVLIEAVERP